MDKFESENIQYFIKCIENGKYCSPYAHKETWNEWEISNIERFSHVDYSRLYNDTIFFHVDIYHTKEGNESCYDNGFNYFTSRTVKFSDVNRLIRKEKLKKINNEQISYM